MEIFKMALAVYKPVLLTASRRPGWVFDEWGNAGFAHYAIGSTVTRLESFGPLVAFCDLYSAVHFLENWVPQADDFDLYRCEGQRSQEPMFWYYDQNGTRMLIPRSCLPQGIVLCDAITPLEKINFTPLMQERTQCHDR